MHRNCVEGVSDRITLAELGTANVQRVLSISQSNDVLLLIINALTTTQGIPIEVAFVCCFC